MISTFLLIIKYVNKYTKIKSNLGEQMKKYSKILIIFCTLFVLCSQMFASAVNTDASEDVSEDISADATVDVTEGAEADAKKTLYLTFDDGPSEYTEELLDLLKAHDMKATFFMLETEMKRYPEVVKRMVNEGHAVGVHGVTHERSSFYAGELGPLKEMEQANLTLETIIGKRTCLARTPYGSSPYLTRGQEKALESHQYVLWDWNIDSRDWCYRNAQKTFYNTTRMIQKSEKEPKVVLFHDIKGVLGTMNLMLDWMDAHHYTSFPITETLQPVKLYRKK